MNKVNWLRLAQMAWVVLVSMALFLYVLGGIVYFQQLSQICTGTRLECHEHELATPEDFANLQREGLSLRDWAIANIAYRVVITATFAIVGFLIFARKRNEWNGLLFSYFLIAFGSIGGHYPALIANYPALALPVNIVGYMAYVAFALFFATFPDGRVVPRAMWIPVLVWSVSFFLSLFFDWPARSDPLNTVFAAVVWLGMLICGMLAQVYRYVRVSNAEEQRQTKWVLFGIVILVLSIVTLYFSPLSGQFGDVVVYSRISLTLLIAVNLLLLLIPITIGIAILRSRLFDIDVIIRRTVTYAIVVALLGVVYFGSVILLQRLFAGIIGDNSEIVTVLSTLAIAALFIPLRNRIQNAIDKRFNRQRYNAQKVLQKFAETVRDETDLDKLNAELVNVVNETMQPKTVSLWLKTDHRRQTTDKNAWSSAVRRLSSDAEQ
jgi:hypothetical protein